MGARVRVELRGRKGRQLITAALLNGGFESRLPAVLLPPRAAAQLLSTPLSKAPRVPVHVVTGKGSLRGVSEKLRARVVAPDRKGRWGRLRVLGARREYEVVVSDTTIDALGVQILNFGRGLWRFRGERRVRRSEPPVHW